ncbi:glucose-1-phosphate adenylyltransferase large subunit 1-like [Carex rostrata]
MEFSGALTLRANACATVASKNGVAIGVSKNGAVSRIGAGEITKLDMSLKKTSLRWDVKRQRPGAASFVVTSSLESSLETQTMYFTPPKIETKADPKSVAAIILGGGTGAHLFPLTSTRATPAVPLGGCYRLVDIPMSNCFNSGVNKIFIMTQFNSASLNRHITRTYNLGKGVNLSDGFVEVLAATQTSGEKGMTWFRGTADAVRQFIWMFEDQKMKDVQNFLILSGDQLYRMDYMKLIQHHMDTGADISVSCALVDESRASDYGLVKLGKSGRITQFSEKPRGPDLEDMRVENGSVRHARDQPYIASMGVYVFNRQVLFNLLRSKYASSNDFGSEILPSAVTEYQVQSYIFDGYWEDIGTIKSFFEANLALTNEYPKFEFHDSKNPFFTSPRYLPPTKMDNCQIKDTILSHGCFLHECTVERSIVGVRSRLDVGCELKDTLMMGADIYETEEEMSALLSEGKVPVGVGRNTKIKNCIIDMNARIGRDVIISNKEGVQEADRPQEGFYIRSGITVVAKNATIKNGTVI